MAIAEIITLDTLISVLKKRKLIMGVIKMAQQAKNGIVKEPVLAIIFLIVLLVALLAIFLLENKNPSLILPVVGVASFAIPIVLSFSDKYNLGTRLDNGEVRKAIAIALTVVYIIMLTLFFINVTLPQPQGNASTEEDQKNVSGLLENNVLILPLVQSAAAEDQPASTNEGTNNSSVAFPSSSTEETKGVEAAKEETNETDNSKNPLIGEIPDKALANIYTNFLYVYILIIGFYFGSRVFEDFAAVRMTKELTGSDPKDLLKRRLAMGEISKEDYETRIALLEGRESQSVSAKKITES